MQQCGKWPEANSKISTDLIQCFNVDSMKVINNAPVDDDADDGKGGKREGKGGSGCRWGCCNDIVCGIIISRSSGMRLNNNTHTMRPATLRCV